MNSRTEVLDFVQNESRVTRLFHTGYSILGWESLELTGFLFQKHLGYYSPNPAWTWFGRIHFNDSTAQGHDGIHGQVSTSIDTPYLKLRKNTL